MQRKFGRIVVPTALLGLVVMLASNMALAQSYHLPVNAIKRSHHQPEHVQQPHHSFEVELPVHARVVSARHRAVQHSDCESRTELARSGKEFECGRAADLLCASGDGGLRGIQQQRAEPVEPVAAGWEWESGADAGELYQRRSPDFCEDFLSPSVLGKPAKAVVGAFSLLIVRRTRTMTVYVRPNRS